MAAGLVAGGLAGPAGALAARPIAPAAGKAPSRIVVPSFKAPARVGARKPAKPAPRRPRMTPAGVVRRPTMPKRAVAPGRHAAYWDGRRYRLNPSMRAPAGPNRRLVIPTRQHALGRARAFTPIVPASIQVDTAASNCSAIQSNETQMAQSSVNPNIVVVAAQAYSDGTNCSDSHPWVFWSHDGGQHWRQQVIPGMSRTAGGDPGVAYDAARNVFVYSFIQFDRDGAGNPINGSINVESSADGASWGNHFILDSDRSGVSIDKPMTAADNNPGSPHFGRVETTWTEFTSSGSVFFGDFTDTGGGSWNTATTSINSSASNCGNGTSPAFDANGEAMTAYYSCNGGDSIREDFSADGGHSWPFADVTVSSIGNIGVGQGGCITNNATTGTNFRCNSFPSLAGDPNASDVGGQGFVVVWANAESGIAQIRGLSTANAGSNWTNPFYGASCCNGDKFFPWVSVARNGRVDIGYSSREDSVTVSNNKGTSFDEHHTDAASLARLRGGSGEFVTYTIDGTLGNPGGSTFIGDYAGQTSTDNSFDTYPVWTDLRGGSPNTRTSQLCYASCFTGLSPDVTFTFGHTTGSSFTDLLRFNTDASFGGAGQNFWNVVGIRNGSDGTSIDNDMRLWTDRYFSLISATSSFSPPFNDYLVENDNAGHAPSQPYYLDVHSFSTLGGTYSVQWDAGHITLGSSQTIGMGSSDVARVFDSLDATGSTVFVGLRPNPGNSSDYSLSLHSAAAANLQGAPSAVSASGRVGPGNPAFVQFSPGANPTAFDGVVVMNNNGGSGTFALYRDTAVPSGTVQINGGATFTTSTAATLTLSASNPTAGDPVLDMRFSTDGGATWSTPVPFAGSSPLTLPAGDGAKTVLAEFRNGAGAWSAPASDGITLDTTAPTMTMAAAPSFAVNSNVVSGKVPVKVTWAATDATSGVCSYQLQESVAGGAFTNVSLPTPTTTTVSRMETPGTSYRYQARATDCAGNTSAFRQGRLFTVSVFQEPNPAITYSAGWTLVAQAGAFGGNVKTATAAGSTATWSFSGQFAVAWVSTKDSASGGAHVSLDGAAGTPVGLNNATTQPARLVYVKPVSTAAHTVKVSVDGSAGHPKVTVDAFVEMH